MRKETEITEYILGISPARLDFRYWTCCQWAKKMQSVQWI